MSEMKLLKNNENRKITTEEWIQEFFDFLQGEVPEGIFFPKSYSPKLSRKKALTVIYYLQEHFPVFPDKFEMCWNCGNLYDSFSEGLYWKTKDRFYCGCCVEMVPRNYDRGIT